MSETTFPNLNELAAHLRSELTTQKYLFLYAYNGTGKTRLSMVFKDIGKQDDVGDTLYFNAFTEDLFTWDNDLDNDSERVLKMNSSSRLFAGLNELPIDDQIRAFLHRYVNFNFIIDYDTGTINFFHEIDGTLIENIKVSRGEENIFVWCFFLAIVQLAMDEEIEAYNWVNFIYIDDPISSLDDNYAIAVAHHLMQMVSQQSKLKIIISSHHSLFFSTICNEKKNAPRYFLGIQGNNGYVLRNTSKVPHFHHIAALTHLHKVAQSGEIYTYHFNMLRNVLEKTATFHGLNSFGDCIKQGSNDENGRLYTRLVNILNHGGYSVFEPRVMLEENKAYFRKILNDFISTYAFNPELFPSAIEDTTV